MTKLKSYMAFLFIIIVGLSSCDTNTKPTTVKEEVEVPVVEPTWSKEDIQSGFWVPKEAKVVKVKNGLQIDLGENYQYVGYDTEDPGELKIGHRLISGCACAGGDGCQTSNVGRLYGCFSMDCERCSMEIEMSVAGKVTNGGVITKEVDITVIESLSEAEELPMAFEAMFKLEAVKKAIAAKYNEIYPNGVPDFIYTGEIPKQYKTIAVNISGRLAGLVVPETLKLTNSVSYGGLAVCNCRSDIGGMLCDKHLSQGVYFCHSKGGCSYCSFDIGDLEPEKENDEVQQEKY